MLVHQIKKYSYLFIVFILVCGTIACEKTLNLNVGTFEPSIAIFGVLEADSVPKLFITESEPYYTYLNQELEYKLIENATVTITDGNETWTLQPDSVFYKPLEQRYGNYGGNGVFKKSWAFTTEMQLKVNTNYTVSVTKNNTTAIAKATVFDVVGDIEVTITEEVVEYDYNYGGDFVQEVLNVEFNSVNYGQYYRALVKTTSKYYDCDFANGNPYPTDTIIREYVSYLQLQQITDSVDIQKTKSYFWLGDCVLYNCMGQNEFLDFRKIEVAIQLVDSNMVKFMNQLEAQDYAAYYPFLEPAPVDHKVENGIGILSSSTTSQWKKFNILLFLACWRPIQYPNYSLQKANPIILM